MLLLGIFSPLSFARGEGKGEGCEVLHANIDRPNPHPPPLLWKERRPYGSLSLGARDSPHLESV